MSKSPLKLERDADGSFTCPDDPGESGYTAGAKRVSVTEQEARLLGALAYHGTVLEIGTGLGVATRALRDCCEQLTTIDTDPWVQQNIFPHLPPSICCLASRDLLDIEDRFDVIFIDGHHGAEAIAADVALAKERLYRDYGLLIFHDANYDHVRNAFASHGKVDVVIPTKHGLGLMWAKDLF